MSVSATECPRGVVVTLAGDRVAGSCPGKVGRMSRLAQPVLVDVSVGGPLEDELGIIRDLEVLERVLRALIDL